MFMQKGTNTIIWVGGVALLGYAAWYMVKNMHVTPRQKSILGIAEKKYEGMEDEYLKEWAKAAKIGQSEFSYKGKVYLTDGGSAKR